MPPGAQAILIRLLSLEELAEKYPYYEVGGYCRYPHPEKKVWPFFYTQNNPLARAEYEKQPLCLCMRKRNHDGPHAFYDYVKLTPRGTRGVTPMQSRIKYIWINNYDPTPKEYKT